MTASILIVTRNRAADLKLTLEAMRGVMIPEGFIAELIVVDNGSTDDTRKVVEGCLIPGLEIRYVLESKPGLSHGRNRGIAEARGEILLFTDDDIRPPRDWIAGMCEPILDDRADAVAGGVKIAAPLLRPWMSSMHRSWLASSEWLEAESPQNMVGANMVFSKKVLEKVPSFDVELGAGALGSGEESLFGSQLITAGYRIANRLDLCMEHHFQEDRLKRESWLNAAKVLGKSHAYRGHHWEHWGLRFGRLRLGLAYCKLMWWRFRNANKIQAEGCDEVELNLVYQHSLIQYHVEVHQKPRNYERHGLKKLEYSSL